MHTIRKILTQHAAQLLVQSLVISTGLLQCSSSWNSIMHNQTFTDDSKCIDSPAFNEPMSHLSLSPCTGSRLQLASSSRHWCLHKEQPQAQHPPTSTHYYESTSPPEVWDPLVSDASWCHHREAQNHSPERFHSPLLAAGMNFPPPSGMMKPWQFLSLLLLDFIKIKNKYLCFLSWTSPCLARIYSEQ